MAISDSSDSAKATVGFALMLACPLLFLIGAWLLDRQIRRRHGSGAKRWLGLSLFSALILALFAVFIRVPASWQFSSGSATLVSISYMIGFGWLSIPLIAVPCLVTGVCGVIISRAVESRRHAATRKV